MHLFSEDTAWVTANDIEGRLYMSIPLVLRLATIHYYAESTFSYISVPIDTLESRLMRYHLVYISNADVYTGEEHLGSPVRSMVQLALTVKGQEFLKKIPLVRLVAELISPQFSPDRNWRWYPYSVPVYNSPNDAAYKVSVKFMDGLTALELPQFLSHEISTIREKASELLDLYIFSHQGVPPNCVYT